MKSGVTEYVDYAYSSSNDFLEFHSFKTTFPTLRVWEGHVKWTEI